MMLSKFRKFVGAAMVTVALVATSAWAQAEPMSNLTAMEYFTENELFIGVNMGNSLEAYQNWQPPHVANETAWGNVAATQAYFNALAAHGFKIVRIPVSYIGRTGAAPNYTIDAAWLNRIEQVVGMANNAGLKAIINIHHDGAHGNGTWMHINSVTPATMQNHEITQRFVKIWEQVAERFKDHGDYLIFQAFNELHDGGWGSGTPAEYQIINHWNQRFTDAVRNSGGNNEKRYLAYYGYNTHASIASTNRQNFVLPTDPIAGNGTTRMIVGFHFYDPFPFAHDGGVIKDQNGNITGDAPNGDVWDTPQNRNHITTTFQNFKREFVDNGIPVIIGECGPARYLGSRDATVAHANRLTYIEFMYSTAKANGIAPIYWETGHDSHEFALFPRSSGLPNSERSAEVIAAMITAVGGTSTGGGGNNEFTILDNFNDLDAVANTGEPWYIYTMGANTTIGNARDTEGNYIVKTDLGYAELFGINTNQSDWGDFSGAALALETNNNGTDYDLGDGEGFTYKFRGAAHEFAVNMEVDGHQVTFVGRANVPANNTNDWVTVTVNELEFTRSIYDGWCNANGTAGTGGVCTSEEAAAIPFNLSEIVSIVWTVRGFTEAWVMTDGKFELNEVAAIGRISGVSIAEIARDVPSVDDNVETVVVAPVARSGAVFTAGPNPVSRQSGLVSFYLADAEITSGSLTVYDASGNVVRRLTVGASNASWDLRDARGRSVSAGSYLVRGTLNGNRVSSLVGVTD